MSIKNIILAAVAVIATTSAVSANAFDVNNRIDQSDVLQIGLVTADNAGTLEIYDFRLGTQGRLLGSEAINAGANTDVSVPLGFAPVGNVLAVLTVNGQAVASQKFFVENN